jgi:hypothetical protein
MSVDESLSRMTRPVWFLHELYELISGRVDFQDALRPVNLANQIVVSMGIKLEDRLFVATVGAVEKPAQLGFTKLIIHCNHDSFHRH